MWYKWKWGGECWWIYKCDVEGWYGITLEDRLMYDGCLIGWIKNTRYITEDKRIIEKRII